MWPSLLRAESLPRARRRGAGLSRGRCPWLPRLLGAALCAALLCVLSAPARALDVALVLSQPGGPHAAFARALQAALKPGKHRLLPAGSVEEGIDASIVDRADLVIASGTLATEAMLRDHRRRTLGVLVGARRFAELMRRYPQAEATAIVLDQPVDRHLRLIAAALPRLRRVGVLLGPDSAALAAALDAAAAASGLELARAQVDEAEQLVGTLETLLADSGALLALPDSELSGPAAARSILLTSYRFRRPIFAFSAAYVEAGALAAVFSTPEQIALDVADWLHALRPGRLRLGPLMHPLRFEVAVNRQVARALNLAVPAERDLREQAVDPELSR